MPESAERVLVTRLRNLGDVVISTPMLDALRTALPRARIDYLTYPQIAPVLDGHPACDRVILAEPKASIRSTLATVRTLRALRFDWCFDTLVNPRSVTLIRLGAPRRSVGHRYGLRSLLYTDPIPVDEAVRSEVRRHLDLLTPLLGRVEARHTSLSVSVAERERAAARPELRGGSELIIVHPGASRVKRAWALEHWPQLIGELQRRFESPAVRVITQPGWEQVTEEIVSASPGDVQRLPVLPLRDLLGALTRASVYVGNDGGVLHCAVALRVPTVGIIGQAERARWFPYEDWGPYRCVGGLDLSDLARPKRAQRMPRVTVTDVLDAIEEVRAIPRVTS